MGESCCLLSADQMLLFGITTCCFVHNILCKNIYKKGNCTFLLDLLWPCIFLRLRDLSLAFASTWAGVAGTGRNPACDHLYSPTEERPGKRGKSRWIIVSSRVLAENAAFSFYRWFVLMCLVRMFLGDDLNFLYLYHLSIHKTHLGTIN